MHPLISLLIPISEALSGDNAVSIKVTPTNFVEKAWLAGVRVVDWPEGVPFFNVGIKSQDKFIPGVSNVNKFSAAELAKICDPRIKQIRSEVEQQEATESEGKPYFRVIRWSPGKPFVHGSITSTFTCVVHSEESNLPLVDQAKLALVSDTAGNIIAAVSHATSYHTAVKDATGVSPTTVHPESLPLFQDVSEGSLPLFQDDSDEDLRNDNPPPLLPIRPRPAARPTQHVNQPLAPVIPWGTRPKRVLGRDSDSGEGNSDDGMHQKRVRRE